MIIRKDVSLFIFILCCPFLQSCSGPKSQEIIETFPGVDSSSIVYSNLTDLLNSVEDARGVDAIWETQKFKYRETAPIETVFDLQTQSGVKLKYLVESKIWYAEALGSSINLQDFIDSASGETVVLKKDEVYTLLDEIRLPPGTILDLNSSTLEFDTNGLKKNLLPESDTVVKNGTISYIGGSSSGHGGYNSPISVGNYTVYTAYKNVVLENLNILSNRDDGNGIFITSASENIVVRNVHFPGGAEIGRGILVHWGANGAAVLGTYHPKNILIENITSGVFSRKEDLSKNGEVNLVFLSACSDVTVKNVSGGRFEGGSIVFIYAGDFGFEYGSLTDRVTGMQGINIEGVIGQASTGVQVGMRDVSGPKIVWPSSISISGVQAVPVDATIAPSAGIRAQDVKDLTINNNNLNGWHHGIYLNDGYVEDLAIINNQIINSHREGIGGISQGSKNWIIEANDFTGNNVANLNTGYGTPDIHLRYVEGLNILNNTFKNLQTTNHILVRGEVDKDENLRVTGNKFERNSASSLSYGSGTDISSYQNNTFDSP